MCKARRKVGVALYYSASLMHVFTSTFLHKHKCFLAEARFLRTSHIWTSNNSRNCLLGSERYHVSRCLSEPESSTSTLPSQQRCRQIQSPYVQSTLRSWASNPTVRVVRFDFLRSLFPDFPPRRRKDVRWTSQFQHLKTETKKKEIGSTHKKSHHRLLTSPPLIVLRHPTRPSGMILIGNAVELAFGRRDSRASASEASSDVGRCPFSN
ncbi:hypothetical protein C8F04DRAFT_405852 [Mycena alexandri]|uniref:Uncharacterized protein n=1 Tax=Mycena alexandri TaxID=1745969 RepID=A0AAD6RYX0_9AGAR|nr:hypothetical protein C8F04DRAFT_405852 [Mycena alexandri]